MTRKRAKSADQTSLGTPGTTEMAGALRSPPRAYGEPRRLLSSAPFHSSSGECRLMPLADIGARIRDVGFTPKNRHYVAGGACPFRARKGH
jgi:hypothetical protein